MSLGNQAYCQPMRYWKQTHLSCRFQLHKLDQKSATNIKIKSSTQTHTASCIVRYRKKEKAFDIQKQQHLEQLWQQYRHKKQHQGKQTPTELLHCLSHQNPSLLGALLLAFLKWVHYLLELTHHNPENQTSGSNHKTRWNPETIRGGIN